MMRSSSGSRGRVPSRRAKGNEPRNSRRSTTTSGPTIHHTIEERRVDDLVPWDGNPRRISDAARAGLDASIARFGLVQPIVWNKRTGRVVGGHQRLEVLRARGVEQAEVVVVDLAETEERALNLALNNQAIAGDWTPDAREILAELSASFDAFKDLRLDTLLDELARTNLRDGVTAGKTDEDEAVEPPKEPRTKPGDLWLLGPHRLLCGDSTDPAVLSRAIGDTLADGLFTDPPYNVDYAPEERGRRKGRAGRATGRNAHSDQGPDRAEGRNDHFDGRIGRTAGQSAHFDAPSDRADGRFGRTAAKGRIANDNLDAGAFADLLGRAFGAMDAALRPGAPIYVCGPAGWEARHFWAAWPEDLWHFQVAIAWDKGRFALSRWDYHPAHEVVFYGWKRGAEHTWLGGRKQASVWAVEMGSGKHYIHPTQKPVALVRRALLNSVPEGGLVLDPFGGSGSTLIAAETCGRRACLCEVDPRFVDAAVGRWERYTGQKATKPRGRTR